MSAPRDPPQQAPKPDRGLRGPHGCLEWTVVLLGVIWAVLMVVFVLALVLR